MIEFKTATNTPPTWNKGDRVFCVLPNQTIHAGRVLSHRGLEVRIANDKGVVRMVHARYVFADKKPQAIAFSGVETKGLDIPD